LVQETLALTRRLFIQLQRRPSTLIAGIIQPVMWLVLFGGCFKMRDYLATVKAMGSFLVLSDCFTAFAGA